MPRRSDVRVQRLSVRTQTSSAMQLGDARRERDRRGRPRRTAAGTGRTTTPAATWESGTVALPELALTLLSTLVLGVEEHLERLAENS